MSPKLTRRELLKSASALAICTALPRQAKALEERMQVNERLKIKLHVIGSDGKPVLASKDALGLTYLVDEYLNPIRTLPTFESDGLCTVARPNERFTVTAFLKVPGFGELWTYADDGGSGFKPAHVGDTIDLNDALASSRLKKVERILESAKAEGCEFSGAVSERMGSARALLGKSRKAKDAASAAGLALESLSNSMWAGELVAFQRAQHRIKKAGPRPDFLFGCNAFHCLTAGPRYTDTFRGIFNFATLPFYWTYFEPQDGKPNYEQLDKMVEWCRAGNVVPKGHPLIFLCPGGVPDWLPDREYGHVKERIRRHIRETVSHYAGRIRVWDVINEAHGWTNLPNYTYDELDDLTRMACEETKAADPKAIRVVNDTIPFGDDSIPHGCGRSSGEWMRTVYQYMDGILRKGVEFDAIGLQLYSPKRDMLELDLVLERFAKLKKRIHVTEQGVPSQPWVDEGSMVKYDPESWHGPWSETIQADWAEQFWTIAYSKPAVRALTWWDFWDQGHFWPYGGFLRADKTPKESYWRLRGLIQGWRQMT